MRKLFTYSRAERRSQRLLFASFVLGAAAVLVPGLAFTVFSQPAVHAPKVLTDIREPLAVTRAAARMDCSSFDNQWEAQAFLQTQNVADRHLLDDDRDGVACENLP
jgi:hypothetical protein